MTTLATSNGPIEFTDPVTGAMELVPVGALTYDGNGTLVIAAPYDKPGPLSDWLKYLSRDGQIQASPAVIPTPAMVITAASPGSQGNNIQVTVTLTTPNADPTLAVFKVVVTQTDSYTGLTLSTIKGVLGTSTKSGSRPGLVHLLDSDTPTLPAKIGSAQSLTGGTVGAAAKFPVTGDPSGTAFTLEAKLNGDDGNAIKIAIPTVDVTDPANPVFAITAVWTKTVTGATIGTIPATLAALGYVISVAAGSSGAFSLPSDNGGAPYQLSGGSDGSAPTSAMSIIPAGV